MGRGLCLLTSEVKWITFWEGRLREINLIRGRSLIRRGLRGQIRNQRQRRGKRAQLRKGVRRL